MILLFLLLQMGARSLLVSELINNRFRGRKVMDAENNEICYFIRGNCQLFDRASFLKCILSTVLLTANFNFPQRSWGMYTDSTSKILLPEEGEIESILPSSWENEDDPFNDYSSTDFARLDPKPDIIFYKEPRFTEHVDENAVKIMRKYISSTLMPNDMVLDLCSSWTSHIDAAAMEKIGKVSGLGLNENELKSNKCLRDYVVLDLNASRDIKLPYRDESFDVVLCQLSIDYMIYPKELMKEVGRVMKSGGKIHILFSNKLFLQKAVGLWTGKDDLDHVYTVGSYLNFSKGGFTNIMAKDLSTRKKGKVVGDPMYVVIAEKY